MKLFSMIIHNNKKSSWEGDDDKNADKDVVMPTFKGNIC